MIMINATVEKLLGRDRIMAMAARGPRVRSTNPDKTPLSPTQDASQAKPAPSSRQAAAKPQQRPAPARQVTEAEQAKQEADRLYKSMWPSKAAEVPLTADEAKTYGKLWGG